MRRVLLLGALLVLLASHAGCSDDDDDFGPFPGLGAPCREDRECFDRCDEGYCTARCEHDGHCPAGWACIDEHGGVCSPVCTSPASCGPGYQCDSARRRGVDGSITVCLR